MPASKVTAEQARCSLMAFKRQSFAVEPDNKEHQDKYREMRLKFARVSPAMFMKFLDTGKEMVSAGASSAMSFWIVPKMNFPKGLPPKIKAAEIGANDEHAPQDVDHDNFYVIDQCIPGKRRLGGDFLQQHHQQVLQRGLKLRLTPVTRRRRGHRRRCCCSSSAAPFGGSHRRRRPRCSSWRTEAP